MFSALSPSFLFDSEGRLERLPPQNQKRNSVRPKGPNEPDLVANVNLTLSSLNPNHDTNTIVVESPPPASFSFSSTSSNKINLSTSPARSMSSGSSIRFARPEPELSRSNRKNGAKDEFSLSRQPEPKIESSLTTRLSSLPAHPAIHVYNAHTPRPSLDSVSSSNSGRSFKERKVPIVIPPPLHLEKSNHDINPLTSPVIEIVAPPRSDSRRNLVAPSEAPSTPSSPNFQVPSREEQRRRQLEKVMRTLGEPIPAELVYRGGAKPIHNVNVFPDPPTPSIDKNTLKRRQDKEQSKLGRRSSFTLSSFPNISSMTATILPGGHARGKSRDLSSRDAFAAHQANHDATRSQEITLDRPARHQPESALLSPMVFASRRPLSYIAPLLNDYESSDSECQRGSKPQRKEDRASKLTRRSSLHTTTLLPPSPLHTFQAERPQTTPRYSPRSGQRPTSKLGPTRPDSSTTSLSSESDSPVPPTDRHSFHLVVDEHEEDSDEDTEGTVGSHTPSRSRTWVSGGSPAGSAESHHHPNKHLMLHTRPDTPFADSGVSLRGDLLVPPEIGLLPPGKGENSRDVIVRKERRQGWSGEWNRGDMQDVIQKLRSLK